jgi:hypothetical protein
VSSFGKGRQAEGLQIRRQMQPNALNERDALME